MTAESPFAGLGRSPLIRLLVVLFLSVVMQVPVLMIEGLIGERRTRRDAALDEVASSWGRSQMVSGPILVLPYVRHVHERTVEGKAIVRDVSHQLRILPRTLLVEGRLEPQERRRGIF